VRQDEPGTRQAGWLEPVGLGWVLFLFILQHKQTNILLEYANKKTQQLQTPQALSRMPICPKLITIETYLIINYSNYTT
jgi:hypothetical protein